MSKHVVDLGRPKDLINPHCTHSPAISLNFNGVAVSGFNFSDYSFFTKGVFFIFAGGCSGC